MKKTTLGMIVATMLALFQMATIATAQNPSNYLTGVDSSHQDYAILYGGYNGYGNNTTHFVDVYAYGGNAPLFTTPPSTYNRKNQDSIALLINGLTEAVTYTVYWIVDGENGRDTIPNGSGITFTTACSFDANVTSIVNNVNCNGGNDGSIDLTVTGNS